jgi:hypothetical protein
VSIEAIGVARLHEAGFGSVAETLLDLADDPTVSPDVYEKVCEAVFTVLNAWAEERTRAQIGPGDGR